jgi:hypothetical protein
MELKLLKRATFWSANNKTLIPSGKKKRLVKKWTKAEEGLSDDVFKRCLLLSFTFSKDPSNSNTSFT